KPRRKSRTNRCFPGTAFLKNSRPLRPISVENRNLTPKKCLRTVEEKFNARLIGWNRALKKDIDASLACGLNAAAVSLPVSDIHIKHKLNKTRGFVVEQLRRAIHYARRHKLYVIASAEDASRADFDFLIEYIKASKEEGAQRFRFCDTVGVMEPFKMFETIKRILEIVRIDIEVHTHNDFGMAGANALAGLRAGAIFADTTVTGIGERAGNAALEEITLSLLKIYGVDPGIDIGGINKLSRFVSRASRRRIPPDKPIIGRACFLHESGVHQDGIVKNPLTYEPFDPALIGSKSRLVMGKHSGRTGLRHILAGFGACPDDDTASHVLEAVRRRSVSLKHCLSAADVYSLYCKEIQ
ncbi:MAG: hypothetical protein HZC18_01240, partial [Candidatus Omnitrophica bacterium]|nr:hypothetical protein [Candidatus Omnitrophota bacterium]